MGPVILYARDARRGQIVVAANATARGLGITTQMPLSQTSTLCPDAERLEHDPQADLEALCSLAESAQCFSPIVGIETVDQQAWAGRSLHQPQGIFLDVTGIAPLFGNEMLLANTVHQWFASQGYLVAIGLASSMGAAWAIANYGCRSQIAKDLESYEREWQVPHSYRNTTIVDQDEPIGPATFGLPVESLRLDHATVTKLMRLGIRKVGQLIELPRAGLVSRFDAKILERIDQTVHARQEPIQSLHDAPSLAIEQTLEHPTPMRETIDSVIQDQLSLLMAALDEMGHGVIRLVCRIVLECNSISVEMEMKPIDTQPSSEHPKRDVRIFQIGLYQPSNDPKHLMWLLAGQLDANLEGNRLKKGMGNFWVKSIGIQATQTAPIVWQQTNLFERDALSHRDTIAKLIDGLSSRLGRKAVVAPSLHRNPQPELAFSWRPLTGWRKDGQIQETKRKLAKAPKRNFADELGLEPPSNEAWRRPTRLIQPPQKIDVVWDAISNQPSTVRYRGDIQRVRETSGPERIDSGWWQGITEQRDYYRVKLDSGPWLWIYRDRRNATWMLHGEFD